MLAGGKGTRIQAIAKDRPKVLLDIEGNHFLSHKLDEFTRNGIEGVMMLTGIGAAHLETALRSEPLPIPVATLNDGPSLRGTGGALLNALPLLPDYFYLTYGDTLLDINYRTLQSIFEEDPLRRSILVVTKPQFGPGEKCNTAVDEGMVVSHSKTDTDDKEWMDYGLALLNKRDICGLSFDKNDLDLSVIYSELSSRELLRAHLTEARYREIGTPSSYESVKTYMRKSRHPR